jgi:galactonate dehydratase
MEAQAEFARRAPMPIATEERLQTIYQFSDLLSRNGAAFIRSDISLAGGISGIKNIAALTEAHYVGVVPHNPMGAVATAACTHLDAALHNPPI